MKKKVYMNTIRDAVLRSLKEAQQSRKITRKQYRTLRGQVYHGDACAAMKGLHKILEDSKKPKN